PAAGSLQSRAACAGFGGYWPSVAAPLRARRRITRRSGLPSMLLPRHVHRSYDELNAVALIVPLDHFFREDLGGAERVRLLQVAHQFNRLIACITGHLQVHQD